MTEIKTITLLGGAKVTVDLTQKSKCKKCKKDIVWAVTSNAKNMPICQDKNGNWISHFSDCFYAKDFRKGGDLLDESEAQKERDKRFGE